MRGGIVGRDLRCLLQSGKGVFALHVQRCTQDAPGKTSLRVLRCHQTGLVFKFGKVPSIEQGNQLAFFCDQLLGTVTLSQTELTLVEPDINDLDFPFAHALDSVYIKQFWRNTNGTIFIELSLLDLLKSPDFISITH